MVRFEPARGAVQPAAMQVLATGACGRIGREVLERLCADGHRAVAFDVPTRRNRRIARGFPAGVKIVWGDIRSMNDVARAVGGCDAAIHNAGILAPTTEQRPELGYAVNVGGTTNLINALEANGKQPRLVYASTFSVYGPRAPGGLPLTLDDPVVPTDHYTSHKVECERRIRESGLPWVICRIGVSVSAETKDFSPEIFRLLFGIDPDTRIEYVHPRDVALAQVRAAIAPAATDKVFLIGGGASCRMTFAEFYSAIFSAAGIGPLPSEAYGREPYYCDWLDTTESQAILQYQEHTFADFIAEYRRQSRWTRPVVRFLSPLIRAYLLRYSAAWQRRRNQA